MERRVHSSNAALSRRQPGTRRHKNAPRPAPDIVPGQAGDNLKLTLKMLCEIQAYLESWKPPVFYEN